MTSFQQKLKRAAQRAGIVMADTLAQKLTRHWQLLSEANAHYNLTAIVEPDIATEKHYMDCLIAGAVITSQLKPGATVADIGSGGGFPGLIWAAAWPELKYTLIESSQKKHVFLQEAAIAMEIGNVQILCRRAEEAGRDPDLRAAFTAAVARAVSNLSVLMEYALPLLAQDGLFFAMKGPCPKKELLGAARALELLGGTAADTTYYHLPISDEKRSIVVIHKTSVTPDKYPRRPGLPGKRPL